VILDNSVIELGYIDLGLVQLALQAFIDFRFSGKLILVAPDVLKDSAGTLHMHKEFLSQPQIFNLVSSGTISIMVIPQGVDDLDVLKCLTSIFESVDISIDYIGIPRLTEDFEGGRQNIFEICKWLIEDRKVHLLGI